MYERFTDCARKVMQFANQEAQRFNHEYIGTEHILLGLVKEGSGIGANVLTNLDIDLRRVRLEVEKIVMSGSNLPEMGRKLPQTPRAKKAIEFAIAEAKELNHKYVGTEHLLLGLVREGEGVAAQVLINLGLKLEDVRDEILNLLGHSMEKPIRAEEPPLTTYSDAPISSALKGISELIALFGQMKEAAVAGQDFEYASLLRDEEKKLLKVKEFLVRERHREPNCPIDLADGDPMIVESSDGPKSMFECELNLPTRDAASNQLSADKLAATERRLSERFGKVYSVPASRWVTGPDGKLMQTNLTVWRFMAPDQPETRDFLKALKAELEAEVGQKVLISLCPVKVV